MGFPQCLTATAGSHRRKVFMWRKLVKGQQGLSAEIQFLLSKQNVDH